MSQSAMEATPASDKEPRAEAVAEQPQAEIEATSADQLEPGEFNVANIERIYQ